MAFAIGDVVELKSGGPAMTVEAVVGDTVQAAWFDDKSKVNSRVFGFNAVKFVEEQLEPEENEEL